ncbi:MAG: NUDIX hydrolase [Microscillaceae bacterium]|nr:NUDIX hydrolase [Microscillaceae bacterium]
MNNLQTIYLIKNYQSSYPLELQYQTQILHLIETYPDDFYKSTLTAGHLTGSAWIVSSDYQQILLTHHRKLDKWLQPGGHCETDDADIWATAWREAQEETGLQSLQKTTENIFDIDVHWIPARGDMPAHEHHDIRFLFVAQAQEALNISAESNDLRWFTREEVLQLTDNESIIRMVRKMSNL